MLLLNPKQYNKENAVALLCEIAKDTTVFSEIPGFKQIVEDGRALALHNSSAMSV